MLTQYETLTAALIQAPSSPSPLISTAVLDSYINLARSWIATDGECVRTTGTLPTVAGTNTYSFGAIVSPALTLFSSVITVRSLRIGTRQLDLRPFEWFDLYSGGSALSGTPLRAAQQQQGANGTLVLDPTPDAVVTIYVDAIWLPIPLVTNATLEAIPALWTDAVPFYAAWLALQSLQRQADANLMFERYQAVMRRAREIATPSRLPEYQLGGVGTQLAATHQQLGVPPAPARGR